jgi:hypothetical protein
MSLCFVAGDTYIKCNNKTSLFDLQVKILKSYGMNAGCIFSLRCNHSGHPWLLCPKGIKHFTRQGSLKMYAEGGHHPQEELAKFGHRSERKVEIFENPLYVLATCLILLSKYDKSK